jgi:hypothetical protein
MMLRWVTSGGSDSSRQNAVRPSQSAATPKISFLRTIDVETGEASGIETDNLTFFTSWRIVTKVLDKYETVCSFPADNNNQNSLRQTTSPTQLG